MKKAKLKIDYFTCSSDATIKDIFKKGDILTYDKKLKMYYSKGTNSLSTYPEIFIEKNTDIFEIFEEPEPQEEVIEGFVINQINEIGCDYFVKQKTHQMQTPATLILNPQKTDIEKYKKALHILGSIWFYGDFKAETPNEKELEKIMIELGYKYKSGTAVFLGNPNPKKRKEYVGYLSKKGLSEMQRGETPMYISMNKDKNYYIEITITVEDE